MKYNRSNIMKKAWELFRGKLNRSSFATCLRIAWAIAKAGIERETFTGKKAVTMMGFTFRFWKGGKQRRVYVNGAHTRDSYIDLSTMTSVLVRNPNFDMIAAVECFLAKYEIAC